jgi:hypothetical protein
MLNVRLAPLVALTAVLTVARSAGKLRAAVLYAAAVATVAHAANAANDGYGYGYYNGHYGHGYGYRGYGYRP